MTKPIQETQGADPAVQRIRDELKELFGRIRGSREVLPHLAGVEQALETRGIAGLDSVPRRVLKRAAMQLQGIVPEPASEGLADLRSRLSKALSAHEETRVAIVRPAHPSNFLTDEKLQVSESSVSDFMRVLEATERKF